MPLFRKKTPDALPFDPAAQTLAVRRSICTGEMTLGSVDRQTGQFHDLCLVEDMRELEEICRRLGVEAKDVKTIY